MARYWGWHNPHVRCWRQDGPKQDSVRHQDHSVPSTTTRHRRKSLFFLRDSSSEPSRKFDWYCSISLLKIVWLCLEDHMGKQGATQAALTPDKKVKLIKKKLTPSKAICHNDLKLRSTRRTRWLLGRKKSAEAVDKVNHLEYPRTRFQAGGSLKYWSSSTHFLQLIAPKVAEGGVDCL